MNSKVITGILIVMAAAVVMNITIMKAHGAMTNNARLVLIACLLVVAIGGYFIYQGKKKKV